MKEQKKEALFWQKLEDGKIQCQLCPHGCILTEGQKGICKVRAVVDGKLHALSYGQVATPGQIDAIEKKPLFHFYPGSKVLSFGGVSCNLSCACCQNYSLSQAYDSHTTMLTMTPEQIMAMAKRTGCKGVAWTYNEPTIHFETYYEWSQVMKKHGLYTVWVSNAFIQAEPLRKISPFIDAVNFDIKAFTEEYYKKYTHSRLAPVLESCILAKELNLHLEITYLVIPTLNDSNEEITLYLDWVEKNLGMEIPLHFTRFHPDHLLTHLPPTPHERILEIVQMARDRKFHYVYAGNIYPNPYEDTLCPSCGKVIIKRSGFNVGEININEDRCCSFCKTPIYIVL